MLKKGNTKGFKKRKDGTWWPSENVEKGNIKRFEDLKKGRIKKY